MDNTCRTRTVSSLVKSIKTEQLQLSHKLQRPEGQWGNQQKTDLIDSILRKYPINPTYAIKEDGILWVIDGIQRLSTIRDFIDDKFALTKNMERISFGGKLIDIRGMKFSRLEEDVQNAILDAELQVYELMDCTETDVREMFRRQNAGKALNAKQLRVVYESDDFNDAVYTLSNHPFMLKITTPTQRKNSTDRDLIIQTLMLISTDKDNDFTSFRRKDIDLFVRKYGDDSLKNVPKFKKTLELLDESFEELKIPITSISQMLYAAYNVDEKKFDRFVNEVKVFLETYSTNEEYKKFLVSGTGYKENVRGRLQYWQNVINNI